MFFKLRHIQTTIILMPLITLLLMTNTTSETGASSVQASLRRTPQTVYSWQPAFIFASVEGDFQNLKLSVDITVTVDANVSVPGLPYTRSFSYNASFATWSSNWYVTAIPGLPARTVEFELPLKSVKAWISSDVSYELYVNDVMRDSGSYTVTEGMPELNRPPITVAFVYGILEKPELLKENFGFSLSGWTANAYEQVNALILVFDDKGISTVSFEYSTNGGPWIQSEVRQDPLMENISETLAKINDVAEQIESLIPITLEKPHLPLGVYNATIPGQGLGNYIMFRSKAVDIDDNNSTSLNGFYYVVNKASSTRLLVIDPHVKLWLLQKNVNSFLCALRQHGNYELPADFAGNLTFVAEISEVMDKYGVVPLHHWELVGKHYNICITWPDEGITELLKSQAEGGFEPHIIYLSNLYLGLNTTSGQKAWNWDLKDIKVDDKSVQQHLIEYVKQNHAGLIASHGTLSDWIVWLGCESSMHFKVGSRGHVGSNLAELNPTDEKTLSAMLGMPQLIIWEIVRDYVAKALCEAGELKPVGFVLGSIPLQVPYVPFNGSLKTTIEGEDHPILQGLPEEFNITIPSIYSEFGFNAYTQVGWQLAMPRALAYAAWWKANETRPQAQQLANKLTKIMENATNRIIKPDNASRIMDSLEWGLQKLYASIISANLTETSFNITLNVPGLEHPLNVSLSIDYQKLLQFLPVKLVALSKDGLASIIAHDKYWDQDGYRAAYLSFEPEASNSSVAEALLTNAVNWTTQWQYRNVTVLLGNLVRTSTTLAEAFASAREGLAGETIQSEGMLLVEEGHTLIELNISNPGVYYILMAHPTTETVEVLPVGAEVQEVSNITEGLTLITINVEAEGIVRLLVTADADSSLNPAYYEVVPEFPTSIMLLLVFAALTMMAAITKIQKFQNGQNIDENQKFNDPHEEKP